MTVKRVGTISMIPSYYTVTGQEGINWENKLGYEHGGDLNKCSCPVKIEIIANSCVVTIQYCPNSIL